jgi:hypothetical protein
MKTMVAFTMALTTLVLATAADAGVQGQRCGGGRYGVWVRAGTPCVIENYSREMEIIEPPHNGTVVLRTDGSIYYSPKPGFTGRDHIRVRFTNRSACQLPEKLQRDHSEFPGPDPGAAPQCHKTSGVIIFVE